MFLPENIDLGKPEKYVLSVRIKRDGFSFFIYEEENRNCCCYQQTVFSDETTLFDNIRRIIFDYNFLTENFKRVDVVFVTQDYELIPLSFCDKKSGEKLYSFTRTKETGHLLTGQGGSEEYKLLFDVNEELYLFLKRSLFNPSFFHCSGGLVHYFKEKAAPFGDANKMLVYFQENCTDIMCFGMDNRVLSARSYVDEHPQDIVYYVLSIWEKLDFGQFSDQLVLVGDGFDPKIEALLKDYIQHVHATGLAYQLADFGEKWREIPLDLLVLTIN